MTSPPLKQHHLPLRELTEAAFAPYGQVIAPRQVMGQSVDPNYQPWTNPNEAQLTLTHSQPRLWIMHLPKIGTKFSYIARHRQVTQCLGSLGGKEWLIAVAPPGDLSDAARPRIEDIVAFRIPGDRIIKLNIATWHAGPHFVHEECQFLNLENMDTRERDFHGVELGVGCHYQV